MRDDPKIVHETVIGEIIDTWNYVKDLDPDKITNLFKPGTQTKPMMGLSSIAKASSNLTMVFPVLASRGVSIEAASMTSKAIEKRCVSMLQMLFSSWQVTDPKTGIANVQDYINQFHSNISTGSVSLDDVFNLSYMESSTVTIPYTVLESIRKDNINNTNHYLPTNINENAIDRFVVQEGAVFSFDANGGTTAYFDPNKLNKLDNNGLKNFEKKVDVASKITDTIVKAKQDQRQYSKNAVDMMKASSEYFKNQVLDSEYKKANELMPTTMIVNFTIRAEQKDGTYKDASVANAVVGVKAKLYPINSDDVINHLVDKTQSRNWITNFIRATTRETSFIKDFVLAIDKAKIDAMSLSDRKSTSDKMWKVLERRATVSRLKRAMHQPNNASAITTLLISQDEVEYIRKYFNIDMENTRNVVGLFEALNLMGFAIVDESLEVVKFIFDEQSPSWETISFSHLERESSDNTYKKVVNLMTKVAR